MKKQFLLLTVLFMAFATVAVGQAPNLGAALATAPTPIPVTAACVASAGPLNPIAGNEYTYIVEVPTPPGDKTFTWFVTTDLNFISATGLTTNYELADGTSDYVAAAGIGYYDQPNGSESVSITWKSFTHNPTAPVFLVIYVEDDGCGNDNLEVYVIKPVHSFTLDIANLSVDGTIQSDDYETCVSAIASAVYNTTSEQVEFEYGINYLFFVVTAANFTHSWMPSFLVGGAGFSGSREVLAVEWATEANALAGTWTPTTGSGTGGGSEWTSTAPVLVQASGETTVGEDGEYIIVRVTIDNNQDETIANAEITLAVDGIMYDLSTDDYETALLGDIHHTEGPAAECPWYDAYDNDIATQILTPRPDINEDTPAAPAFEPTNRG